MKIKKGQIYKRKEGANEHGVLYAEIICVNDDFIYFYERNENWELIENNWYGKEYFLSRHELCTDRYKVGDVFVNKSGDERKVLGVCGEVYFMGVLNSHSKYGFTYTKAELDYYNYKLKDAPQENDIVELTLEEVAELKGIDVSKLRIKD